jgi:threonyl-tRNA synthetase
VHAARAANQEITLTLPDGKQRKAIKNVTTPLEVAKDISSGLAKKVVVAEVDGKSWDLARPLEEDCVIKLFSFDDPEGKDVSEVVAVDNFIFNFH